MFYHFLFSPDFTKFTHKCGQVHLLELQPAPRNDQEMDALQESVLQNSLYFVHCLSKRLAQQAQNSEEDIGRLFRPFLTRMLSKVNLPQTYFTQTRRASALAEAILKLTSSLNRALPQTLNLVTMMPYLTVQINPEKKKYHQRVRAILNSSSAQLVSASLLKTVDSTLHILRTYKLTNADNANFYLLVVALSKIKGGEAAISAASFKYMEENISGLEEHEVIKFLLKITPWPLLTPAYNVMMSLIKSLAKHQQSSLLISIYSVLLRNDLLFKKMRIPQTRKNAFFVLKFCLLGFQAAPTFFHQSLSHLEELLIGLMQQENKQKGDLDLLSETATLISILLNKFSGYPELYSPIQDRLKIAQRDFNFKEPEDSVAASILKNASWDSNSQQASNDFASHQQTMALASSQKAQFAKGLINIGNTCYMNSVLQALYSTLQFRREVIDYELNASYPQNTAVSRGRGSVQTQRQQTNALKELQHLFGMLSSKSIRPIVRPSKIRECLPSYFRQGYIQHDAGEFIKIFLDLLQKAGGKEYPIIKGNFEGKLLNRVLCTQCELETVKEEVFVDLALPLYDEESKSLGQLPLCLRQFFQAQIFEGQNKFYCDSCQGYSERAVKHTIVETLPTNLILTLNRFEYNTQTKNREKRLDNIEIPLTLEVPVHSANKMVEYHLYAIVIHSGSSAQFGHYYTFCKATDGKHWLLFNDAMVSEAPEHFLPSLAEKFPKDTPYILFYQTHLQKLQKVPEELPANLLKFVENDNLSYLREKENQAKAAQIQRAQPSLFAQIQAQLKMLKKTTTGAQTLDPFNRFDRGGGPGGSGFGGSGFVC